MMRQLIREILQENEERLRKARVAMSTRIKIYGDPIEDDIEFQSHASRRSDVNRLLGERELKRIWRENADHAFFKTEIVKFHAIGFMGKVGKSDKTFTDFMKTHHGKRVKDELSCTGAKLSEVKPEWVNHPFFRAGVFVKGQVTYASSSDLSTEWTQNATPEDRKRHAGSGLPKRPLFYSVTETIDPLVLDEEDWNKKVSPKIGRGNMPELIVDNWTIDSFVISSKIPPEKLSIEFAGVIDFCRKNEVLIVDESMRPLKTEV